MSNREIVIGNLKGRMYPVPFPTAAKGIDGYHNANNTLEELIKEGILERVQMYAGERQATGYSITLRARVNGIY